MLTVTAEALAFNINYTIGSRQIVRISIDKTGRQCLPALVGEQSTPYALCSIHPARSQSHLVQFGRQYLYHRAVQVNFASWHFMN